ncbi:fatty acid-binding protein, adipocyte-like isoform X1 [Aquarana catesbeiana]|uniref:fatty acid-binding protein, adipocyte-like isoform X1 n=1 Tax=Aquarana catesbeiana TaxID=8400 RepID=UPI003CC9A48A
MANELLGTWKLVSSDQFDDYMKDIGRSVRGRSSTRSQSNADTKHANRKRKQSAGEDLGQPSRSVCFATRKLAVTLKPDVIICNDGNKWNIKTESTFKNTDLCFVLNELFEETTADGRTCQTTITLDGGKLIQHQKWDEKGEEKESTITREVQKNQLITTCIFGDTQCRRVYDRK